MSRTRRSAVRRIRRVVVLVAGVTGLLAAFGTAAHAYIGHQHAEPLARR